MNSVAPGRCGELAVTMHPRMHLAADNPLPRLRVLKGPGMARAIWTGVLSFGLVSVPVGLYSATAPHEVSFHQFQRGTSDRIRYKRVNERTGREVDFDKIVKGADTGGGHYVMLEQDELDSVAPGRSRSLDIQTFVDLDEIDPIYFDKTYYLAPHDKETAKTYALLRDAMAKSNRAAIGTFVMRGKQYLTTVRSDGDLLVLETMFFADEVRDPKRELDTVPGAVKFGAQELKMAEQLISSMTDAWDPAAYRDSYTDRVNELIRAKGKDEQYEVADEAPEATNVIDLLSALQRSVDAANSRRSAKSTKATNSPKAVGRKVPAKKAVAKKAVGKQAVAKQAVAKQAVAKKAVAKKAVAKKAPAKKAS
ncbi:Ku protein [Jatrophihabitans telluris]|uniref:Non-homologous end joining protein Ku n=1 Tax=Jatrophihabitans telluris TaxID=2038343 RepID=A0ABY4QV62_9ACTN|nr:Ku protein [Jatrophihabitans telluris]UQX87355.1 Ku protein [Jatrophihabitans telluris]